MGYAINRNIELYKDERKELADCPYRKNSNAYKHWMEGIKAMYDCLIVDIHKYIKEGRDQHNNDVQDYVKNFDYNSLQLKAYENLKKQLRKEGREI